MIKLEELKEGELFIFNKKFYKKGEYAFSEASLVNNYQSETTDVFWCYSYSENMYTTFKGNTLVERLNKDEINY